MSMQNLDQAPLAKEEPTLKRKRSESSDKDEEKEVSSRLAADWEEFYAMYQPPSLTSTDEDATPKPILRPVLIKSAGVKARMPFHNLPLYKANDSAQRLRQVHHFDKKKLEYVRDSKYKPRGSYDADVDYVDIDHRRKHTFVIKEDDMPAGSENRVKLISIIRRQIEERLKEKDLAKDYPCPCTIDISRKILSDDYIVTIMVDDYQSKLDFDNLEICINDHKYKLSSKQGVPEVENFTISVCMGANKNIYGFIDALEKLLDPVVEIIDVWKLDYIEPNHNHGHWSGILRILASLVDGADDDDFGQVVESWREGLPGWIQFDNEEIELEYFNRKPWCTRCKSNALSFHTTEDCPQFDCSSCKHHMEMESS